MHDELGLRGYEHIEFYVGSAKATAYWFARALGMTPTAYRGPETGVHDRVSYLLEQQRLKILLTSALGPASFEVQDFVARHGDGIKRWSLEVEDVARAWRTAVAHGAISASRPRRIEDERGHVDEAALRIYDDTEILLVNRDHYRGFRPGFAPLPSASAPRVEPTGLAGIDHIVGNVRENEMNRWADYLDQALGFETFIDFKAGDIGTKYSALLSKVVRSKDGVVKNPINEPYAGLKKSQIEEFLEEYGGSGVQHVALFTGDIVRTVRALRANGVDFQGTPAAYYQALRARKDLRISERVDELEELGILCDIEGQGYLLQIFTRPIGDRPTFFFEIIQRRNGARGFGKGNFQALFEAIEADQARRGSL